jgi:hypothetical protein
MMSAEGAASAGSLCRTFDAQSSTWVHPGLADTPCRDLRDAIKMQEGHCAGVAELADAQDLKVASAGFCMYLKSPD